MKNFSDLYCILRSEQTLTLEKANSNLRSHQNPGLQKYKNYACLHPGLTRYSHFLLLHLFHFKDNNERFTATETQHGEVYDLQQSALGIQQRLEGEDLFPASSAADFNCLPSQ